MDPLKLIEEYYSAHPDAREFLLAHSRMVAGKALEAADRVKHLNPDREFIHEASMLHDIGIYLTSAPRLGCSGDKPYICHGVLGAELLRQKGFPRHAMVCERHVGVGLTAEDVREKKFPLPEKDMTPQSLEEIIVCFADKFFSKDSDPLREKPVERVRDFIGKFGKEKLEKLDEWLRMFGYT